MIAKLLNENHLEKEVRAQANLSLQLSKCHIVGNHMSRLLYIFVDLVLFYFKVS